MNDEPFLHHSVACLRFLCQDGGCQLLGVCDVGAPGHYPAHQLGGEDVTQVEVNFLPHVSVATVRRGFRVLRHVGGSVGGHCEVSAVRGVSRAGRMGRERMV